MASRERIDVLLVERGLCETRARAQALILAGEVVVDDQRVDKAGSRIPRDAEIRLKSGGLRWVSRGGLKLEGALGHFDVPVAGRVFIDVGASTGGFTHVLLESGAARVYAVDVGYGQLAWALRTDARVINLERTHIGKLAPGSLDPAPSGFVIDVSFISLDLVLPALAPHLAPEARGIALVKPQFEVGRAHVGKGGIVRDDEVRRAALTRVVTRAEEVGYRSLGTRESPITGTDGNVEYLAAFAWGRAPGEAAAPETPPATGNAYDAGGGLDARADP